jgi:hypothetical protein
MKKKSILDIEISAFSNYLATKPKNVNLLVWLNSKKYFTEVKKIRSTKDNKMRKELKSKLPAITPSGLFSKRNVKSLLKHSGFIQFDIDFKDNTHINNYSELKKQISNIQEVAYCGLSVSGNGYWGLIPISKPTQHRQHFEALLLKFKSLGIVIDKSCKDVSRLRGYSFDKEAYFNHSASIFTQILKKEIKKFIPKNYDPLCNSESTKNKVEKYLNIIQEKEIDITGDYQTWFSLGCAFVNEFGENGREYFHVLSRVSSKYEYEKTEKDYRYWLKKKHTFSIATFFHYCKIHNIPT